MEEFVTSSDIDRMMVILDRCWTEKIQKIDGSDFQTVSEMVEMFRPHFDVHGSSGDARYMNVGREFDYLRPGRRGLVASFQIALLYAAELKISSESMKVSKDSPRAQKASKFVAEAYDRILGDLQGKRSLRAKEAVRARDHKAVDPLKERALRVLHSPPSVGWSSKAEAVRTVVRELNLTDANAPQRIGRWLDKDERLRRVLLETASPKLFARLCPAGARSEA